MTIADEGMTERAAGLIARWGIPAHLFRDDEARECIAAQLENMPRARSLALEGFKRFIIAGPLDVPPDHEFDKLIYNGKMYQLIEPVKGPEPGGIAIYFDLATVYERTFDVTPYLSP